MTVALEENKSMQSLNPLSKFLSSLHSLITDVATVSGQGIICGPI